MPNGIAVTRMIPMNSKPEKTWPTAGIGTAKPMPDSALVRPGPETPPRSSPNSLAPQATAIPNRIATRPAGRRPG